MPPSAFPDGLLADVQMAERSHGLFYVVTVGFHVGVWTTWNKGARCVTDNCPGGVYLSYNCDYYTACRVFMQAVAAGTVRTVSFSAPDGAEVV
jgi:hypothetical protein